MQTSILSPDVSIPDPKPDARECDCPAFVLRCVHVGDRRLVLQDTDQYTRAHKDDCGDAMLWRLILDTYGDALYAVQIAGRAVPSGCRCQAASLEPLPSEPAPYFGGDYTQALAAFAEAERALLAGEWE